MNTYTILSLRFTTRAFFALALCLLWLPNALASVIVINPDAGGPDAPIAVSVFDFVPGNTLIQGIGDIRVNKVDQAVTYYKQTRLGSFVDTNGTPISGTTLNQAYEITMVLGRSSAADVTGITTTIGDAAGPVNYLKIFYDNTIDSDDLFGTGFDDGTLILSATITQLQAGVIRLSGTNPFDLHPPDDYPLTFTLNTLGALDVTATVTYGNSAFLSVIPPQLEFILANGSTSSPFITVDPAAVFADGSGGTIAPVRFNGTPINLNGAGSDLQLQNDSNTTMTIGPIVPEPSTFILGGIGIVGLVAAVRRRRQATQS